MTTSPVLGSSSSEPSALSPVGQPLVRWHLRLFRLRCGVRRADGLRGTLVDLGPNTLQKIRLLRAFVKQRSRLRDEPGDLVSREVPKLLGIDHPVAVGEQVSGADDLAPRDLWLMPFLPPGQAGRSLSDDEHVAVGPCFVARYRAEERERTHAEPLDYLVPPRCREGDDLSSSHGCIVPPTPANPKPGTPPPEVAAWRGLGPPFSVRWTCSSLAAPRARAGPASSRPERDLQSREAA